MPIFQKEDWDLFFKFTIALVNMDPSDKKSSVLDIEVEPVTSTDPKFCKWEYKRLDATLGTRPTRYLVMDRVGTSQIDKPCSQCSIQSACH